MGWTNFPMPAGQYCARDVKYIKELYDRFQEIRQLHTTLAWPPRSDTITFDSTRYNDATNWKFYITNRGTTQQNAISYLRNRIEAGLLKWWFWNDGARPFFKHETKANVLNMVLGSGQSDWTNEDFVQLGTHSPYLLLDELYEVIDWIAKNIYVRRWLTSKANSTHYAGYAAAELLGLFDDWSPARIGLVGYVEDVCDTLPNSGSRGGSNETPPYAFVTGARWRTDPADEDRWDLAPSEENFTVSIGYDVSSYIKEHLWPTALKDSTVIKGWWNGVLYGPLNFEADHKARACIAIPISIDGVSQGVVNPGGDATWQDQYLAINEEDLDFVSGSDLEYDMDELELKAELYVPPDRIEDIPAWIITTVYVAADCTTNPGTYRCILGHTAAAANEPGVGVDWETYWVLAPEPGWYRADLPGGLGSNWARWTAYGWGIGIFEGFMIIPNFSWT